MSISCVSKILLSVALLAVCLQAAPIAKRSLEKFQPAACPAAWTGKYLVVLEFPTDQPSGSSEQKESPSKVFTTYMDNHLEKDSDVKVEEPTKPDVLKQVSQSPDNSTYNTSVAPPTESEADEKTPAVKSYDTLVDDLMYHVDMNNPALQDVLKMSGVMLVEEEMYVTGASACGGVGFGNNQEDNEPEPTEPPSGADEEEPSTEVVPSSSQGNEEEPSEDDTPSFMGFFGK